MWNHRRLEALNMHCALEDKSFRSVELHGLIVKVSDYIEIMERGLYLLGEC